MSVRDAVLGFLRVPPTPEPPPGSPPRVFRAAPNYFKLRLLQWGLTQMLAIIGLGWAIWFLHFVGSTDTPPIIIWTMRIAELIGVVVIAVRMFFGWMLVQLDYELRWYMLSDRAIRIREGITTIREKTMALANIQNISIRQGPLQRLLGIADVEVKTAGGGGQAGDARKKGALADPMHVGYFRGVANAEEIRDLLSEGVRRQRDTGLGDPDEVHAPVVANDDVPAAIAELLAQARALRAT
jgi:membrane protein YdbS with pleckstrin-like domain